MLPINIRIESDGVIRVFLRSVEAKTQVEEEVILDVDHAGHWIRGIEILGSVGFDLARAVRPFSPKRPLEAGRVGVTYDEEANAAFFYMQMKALPPGVAANYSHSITPPADFGLDEHGGLVWVSFSSQEANNSPEDFLALVDASVERTMTGQNTT
jgi:uncharacterized protein YuzE